MFHYNRLFQHWFTLKTFANHLPAHIFAQFEKKTWSFSGDLPLLIPWRGGQINRLWPLKDKIQALCRSLEISSVASAMSRWHETCSKTNRPEIKGRSCKIHTPSVWLIHKLSSFRTFLENNLTILNKLTYSGKIPLVMHN